jgi:hypothetical protein
MDVEKAIDLLRFHGNLILMNIDYCKLVHVLKMSHVSV